MCCNDTSGTGRVSAGSMTGIWEPSLKKVRCGSLERLHIEDIDLTLLRLRPAARAFTKALRHASVVQYVIEFASPNMNFIFTELSRVV